MSCENLIYAGSYRGTIQKKQLTLYLDERRSHRRALHRTNSFIMKRIIILQTLVAVFLLTGKAHAQAALPTDRIVATHYVKADGKTDVTEALQHLIDTHPNRTIYFPDGVYLLSHSLRTPADPTKSVMLVLDNYARLQASPHWQGGAVVRLGGEHPANNITIPGSNYGLRGGIIDGANVADGISIDGGRETTIQDVSIKHVRIGIHVKHGANSGSSDADIRQVNIVGNDSVNSIGLLVEGYDNTFTNMRIASVHTGVWVKTGGNCLRNIHPLYIFKPTQQYEGSCGFRVEQNNNWLDFCYSDQFATGFSLGRDICATFTNCFCFWYTGKVPSQTAIEAQGQLNSLFTGLHANFHADCTDATIIKAEAGGRGRLTATEYFGRKLKDSDAAKYYLK